MGDHCWHSLQQHVLVQASVVTVVYLVDPSEYPRFTFGNKIIQCSLLLSTSREHSNIVHTDA